jgi:tRNA dimethylallyltransferase
MQIYRRFDIGTGKITPAQMQGVPHYMIDIAEPDERYSVDRYIGEVRGIITDVSARGKNIIIAGGTGLYLNALTQGYNLADAEPSAEIRKKYQNLAEVKGGEYLYELLKKHDPKSAQKISINDTKRLIRALEIFELTGAAKSERVSVSEESEFEILQIVLTYDRAELYERINRRVDAMIAQGLEREVRALLQYRGSQSMQAIGYKEFIEYFDGTANLPDVIEKIKKHSRNYAKRQMTFFRWMKGNKVFIDVNDYESTQIHAKNIFS